MIKVVIIDDEPLARILVKECLEAWPDLTVVAEVGDGFQGVRVIQEFQPDLVFLDIQMPKINGFEMLEILEDPPAVIFTTAFDEFALKAFEASAVDYLLKPFSQQRFDKAINKFFEIRKEIKSKNIEDLLEKTGKTAEEKLRIVVKHKDEIKIIPTAGIHYLEAWDDYVKIHTAEGVFVKKHTLSRFENMLKSHEFVRIHRSFLVNVAEIHSIVNGNGENRELRLKNGFHLPVSKQGFAKLKEILGL